MNTSTSPIQQIHHFFEKYTQALERYDSKSLAYLYHIPCTLLSDDSVTTFNDAGKLEGFFNQGISFYRQFGITHVRYEVWNRREWTARIINVKVNWQYFDQHNNPVYTCDYHYVLRLDKNNQLKIILSTSVNEKERMEVWQGGDKQNR